MIRLKLLRAGRLHAVQAKCRWRAANGAAILLLALLASCGPRTATVTPIIPTPTATPLPLAHEIRFALIGSMTDANVWALFDAKGYSYNNYAVRSGYWPRLYQLSIPSRQFTPMAAGGMPSPVQQEGNFYTATVPLRTDLKWTDGSPFTAEDVAFTINTVLSFQLGFDWHDYYNPDYLDHAEAVDAHTVKFYFKKQPNVGVWQYGALQGPVVQKAYWSSKVAASEALLPPNDLVPQIETLKAQAADLQKQYDAMLTTPIPPNQVQQMQLSINRQLSNLNQANSDLAKAQSSYDTAMKAARDSLYALDDKNEPTLGDWMPTGEENGEWVNKVNPDHPFNVPRFDRVVYKIFTNENGALSMFQNNDVDVILKPNGFSIYDLRETIGSSFPLMKSASQHLSFLVFNLSNPALSDPVLRQVLACMIDTQAIAGQLPDFNLTNVSLSSFAAPDEMFWSYKDILLPCDGLDNQSRLKQAVAMLKSAGYKWDVEPAVGIDAKGFYVSSGESFPEITLLSSSLDPSAAPDFIFSQMKQMGIRTVSKSVQPDFMNYAVFSSHQYDMALLNWRVSEYPGYLCDWFGDGNPFGYHSDRLQSACEALDSTSDLSAAQKDVYEIQSILAQDLPFIPLYSGITYDAYRNVSYPFDHILGGLSGIYGAPSLAIPASQ